MLGFTTFSNAQNIDGIWRGYFITDDGDQYRLEIQVKRNASNAVQGVSYSYLDVRFYGKATMTGTYDKAKKKLRVYEIKTVEIKSSTGDGAAIMNYDLQYSKSGKEEFLEGTYLGRSEVKGMPNPYEWGQSGGGKVFLRRVIESNFYVEPFLRNTPSVTRPKPNAPNTNKTETATIKPKTPSTSTNTTVKNNKTTPPPVNKPAVQKTQPVQKPAEKATAKVNTQVNVPDTKTELKPVPPVANTNNLPVPKPAILKTRSNELMKSLVVNTNQVTIKLYDNGEIDDDTISVYVDNKLMLAKKRLSTVPITLNLTLDNEGDEYEIVMVAENLGRIPPNTSLMVVDAGDKTYKVQITSNEQKNAMVRLRYEKP
ncbi:hypothetical protein ACFS6H_14460 [Terrimonas rubra]|uniref:Uncharacterized protein n=1 Tax=Terrimonas rubra TaxID=1035890 RepID=A0ABW6A6G4_9BACT